jgi:hypothetical protein
MEEAGSHDTKSVVMRLVGIALMWVALAALVNVPSAADAVRSTAFAIVGFVSFAAGLSLFADGIKRELVAQLRRR